MLKQVLKNGGNTGAPVTAGAIIGAYNNKKETQNSDVVVRPLIARCCCYVFDSTSSSGTDPAVPTLSFFAFPKSFCSLFFFSFTVVSVAFIRLRCSHWCFSYVPINTSIWTEAVSEPSPCWDLLSSGRIAPMHAYRQADRINRWNLASSCWFSGPRLVYHQLLRRTPELLCTADGNSRGLSPC